jgi:hypothetical protein
LVIKDRQHDVIKRISTTDSVLCADSIHFTRWKPGNYFWTAHYNKAIDSDDWLMIIPSKEETEKVEQELKEIKERLRDIPESESDRILERIIDLKKWII